MSSALLAVNLATLALSSLFYGAFVVLFASSTYLIVGRYLGLQRRCRAQGRARAPARTGSRGGEGGVFRSTVFISSLALFCTITAHWVITVYRIFVGFIHHDENKAPFFFADMKQTSQLVQQALVMLSILIGDSLIIHRLWVVWERRIFVVIFPVCSLAALTMCSAVLMYTVSHKDDPEDLFTDPSLTSNCFLTLFTNVYCTAFITYKIRSITRIVKPIGGSSLHGFLVIVVESAAIYASYTVFFTFLYRLRSPVQSLAIQCAPPVVGIVNALIQTRVGLGWAVEAQVGRTERASAVASGLVFANNPNGLVTDEDDTAFRPRASVNISVFDPEEGDADASASASAEGWWRDAEQAGDTAAETETQLGRPSQDGEGKDVKMHVPALEDDQSREENELRGSKGSGSPSGDDVGFNPAIAPVPLKPHPSPPPADPDSLQRCVRPADHEPELQLAGSDLDGDDGQYEYTDSEDEPVDEWNRARG
ncbi:hypothetical protein MKEN_00642400 [Mycena kentingensis (nom. inval.)]|nr:hypothetical protein MKEN_00642400 [Mycena kentingensis (nom. inval.)]